MQVSVKMFLYKDIYVLIKEYNYRNIMHCWKRASDEYRRRTLKYEEKGFSREKAEINALMENSMFAIFRDFPDAFLLFGGATLGLFHESVRHSADLDLLARGTSLPKR
jgi:hypothetical protein